MKCTARQGAVHSDLEDWMGPLASSVTCCSLRTSVPPKTVREQLYVVLSHLVSVALGNHSMYQLKTNVKHQHRTQKSHKKKKRSRSLESHNTPVSLPFRGALTIELISSSSWAPLVSTKGKKNFGNHGVSWAFVWNSRDQQVFTWTPRALGFYSRNGWA